MPALEHRILPGPDSDAASLAELIATSRPSRPRSTCPTLVVGGEAPARSGHLAEATSALAQAGRAAERSGSPEDRWRIHEEAAATAEAAGDCEIARRELRLA